MRSKVGRTPASGPGSWRRPATKDEGGQGRTPRRVVGQTGPPSEWRRITGSAGDPGPRTVATPRRRIVRLDVGASTPARRAPQVDRLDGQAHIGQRPPVRSTTAVLGEPRTIRTLPTARRPATSGGREVGPPRAMDDLMVSAPSATMSAGSPVRIDEAIPAGTRPARPRPRRPPGAPATLRGTGTGRPRSGGPPRPAVPRGSRATGADPPRLHPAEAAIPSTAGAGPRRRRRVAPPIPLPARATSRPRIRREAQVDDRTPTAADERRRSGQARRASPATSRGRSAAPALADPPMQIEATTSGMKGWPG
jgi:hypothetical protein